MAFSNQGHTEDFYKGRRPLSVWMREHLPKYLLEDGTEINVTVDPKKLRSQRTVPLMSEREFRDFCDSEISTALRLWVDCRNCGGRGFTGMPGQERICPTCGGLGRALTPFGAHLLELLVWAEEPRALVNQEEIDEKNRRHWIEYEAQEQKEKLLFEMSGKAAEGQRETAAKFDAKIQKAYAEGLAKIEAEKAAKLAAGE